MPSLYDDIIAAAEAHTFTIPDVNIRKPDDVSDKAFPMVVLHEIVNMARSHASVTGEGQTTLAYQADINATACVDSDGTVLSAFDASRRLLFEFADLMDTTFKLTRRTMRQQPSPAPDVVSHLWRGDSVLDPSGYTYRP